MNRTPLPVAPLLRPTLSLVAGILVGNSISPAVSLLPLLAVAVVAALLTSRWSLLQSILTLASVAVLGAVLTAGKRQRLTVEWPDGAAIYNAVVVAEPEEKARSIQTELLLTGSNRHVRAYFQKDSTSRTLAVGDGLAFRGRIRAVGDPGSLQGYGRYLAVHGITGTAYIPSADWHPATLQLGGTPRLERSKLYFLKLRHRLLQRLRRLHPDRNSYAVVAAMALGDRSFLDKDTRNVYNRSGAAHLLALSGLHLSILFGFLIWLFSRKRRRLLVQAGLVAALWAFVFLAGLPTSLVRAAVMLTVYCLLSLSYRHKMSVNVLLFTAMCLLVANPYCLFDVGFQLSFTSVLSILLWLPLAEGCRRLEPLLRHKWGKWLFGFFAVPMAAQLGVAPLTAYYFGYFPVYFLLTNLFGVIAAYLLIGFTLVSLLVPPLSVVPVTIAGGLNSALAVIAGLPGAALSGLQPTALQVVLAYVVLTAVYLLCIKLKNLKKITINPDSQTL